MTSLRKRVLQRTNRFARDLKSLPEHVKAESFESELRIANHAYRQAGWVLRI